MGTTQSAVGRTYKIDRVRYHLKYYGSITPLEALGLYTVYRLASDVEKLRKEMPIITFIRKSPAGNVYAEYQKARVGMRVRDVEAPRLGAGLITFVEAAFGGVAVRWDSGGVVAYGPRETARLRADA